MTSLSGGNRSSVITHSGHRSLTTSVELCSDVLLHAPMCGIVRHRPDRTNKAIWKIAELMAYAMFLNLFLHGAEAFKESYSDTEQLLFTRYWYLGGGEHKTLVPYAWSAVALNVAAFLLFVPPAARNNPLALNLGCLATYAGVYIEKGDGPHHSRADAGRAG